ncbi:MarR family winged helix-turn-helix transcriptional regulator [Novosphingobium sp. Rr 2-17]|uniref:MarR family winged helix-turn-helix transcriptional regulator n=1 Tax=Novosphingobium sp. Rr 2-17 TaxID=555793 RepID=UPI0012F6B5ED|nr:MarR family winged helix-turn-helix transcriptional regulator [Novosphingobium sp. Rr 2-17]
MPEADERAGDFIRTGGLFFLAHRLRRLSDDLVTECERWFAEAGIIAPARTTSMLYLIEKDGPQRITVIASALRQFHPVIIDWVGKLKKLGLVTTAIDPVDRRRTIVSLTQTGRQEVAKIRTAEAAITAAYAALEDETGVSLIEGVAMWESALCHKSLLVRIGENEVPPPA